MDIAYTGAFGLSIEFFMISELKEKNIYNTANFHFWRKHGSSLVAMAHELHFPQ
jgi:hypothetical protein